MGKRSPASSGDARRWAASLWEEATSRWSAREGQDRNYRVHAVHPAIRAVLGNRFPTGGIGMLDLGCGDGSFLDDEENRGFVEGGAYLGVDISPELVREARGRHPGSGIAFIEGDLADPETAARIEETGIAWDVALSVFVAQEMPDVAPFFQTLARSVLPGGIALVVTVHPGFADWLRERGAMTVADELGGAPDGGCWRWAGRYPIVDEPREPFHLPYFHRTLEDYRAAFLRAGFGTVEMKGIPAASVRAELRILGISPFVPFGTNAYWPRIAEGPSALLAVAEKGADA